jgi:predicted DNA-binding protein YlxM (UPF0122 family)
MIEVKEIKNREEKFETFQSNILKKQMVEYFYRSKDGSLFSTIAKNVDVARSRCADWLVKQNKI